MARRVQVDDTGGGLQYSAGWSAIPGDQYNNQGNFGATYMNTLHSATTAASFTYTFNGADGAVYGTINISKNSAGVIDPTWECLVDGKTIPLKDPFPFTENNWVLCSWDSSTVPFGQHTLTVNVKSGGRAFLFDYFTYIPSPNANVNNAGIQLTCTDSALNYGAGWKVYGNNLGRLAPAGGALVSLTFYGTGIMWYGTAPTELPHPNSIASYSIDGQPSTTFTIPGPDSVTHYDQLYFQTPALPLGHHTIVITSGGLTSQTPLVLSYIIVQGGSVQEPPPPNTVVPPVASATAQPGVGSATTVPPPGAPSLTASIVVSNGVTITQTQLLPTSISTAGSASASVNITGLPSASGLPSNASPPSGGASSDSSNAGASKSTAVNGSGSGTPIGAIIGGVLGALLLVTAIVLLVIFWRRRKARQQRALEKVQVQQPFYSDMAQSQSAFNVPHTGEASPNHGEFTSHDMYTHQPLQQGNVQGTFAKTRPPENSNFSNLLSDISPSTPGFSHHQVSPIASSYSRGPASSAGSEATLPSINGSVTPLIPVRRASSKQTEHLAESSSQAYTAYYTPESSVIHSRVMNHEDSGYRIRQAGPSQAPEGTVVEFPPAYTTS